MQSVVLGKEYYHLQEEMMKWCMENVGKGGWLGRGHDNEDTPYKWEIYCMFGNSKFTFENDKDATLFSLRWFGQYES